MGSTETDSPDEKPTGKRRWWVLSLWALAFAVLVAFAITWSSREQIAVNLIEGYLEETGLEARYDIVSIGAKRQVVENVIVGNPEAPDLVIDRLTLDLDYGLSGAGIDAAILENPKIYGTYTDGAVSFGALDPIIFDTRDESLSGLPDIDLTIKDGGALFETDYGDIGLHLDGAGGLDDGFSGSLALTAPTLGLDKCSALSTTAFGDVTVSDGSPRFVAPLKIKNVACLGGEIEALQLQMDVSLDSDLAKTTGAFEILGRNPAYKAFKAEAISGSAKLSFSAGSLVVDHSIGLDDVQSDYGIINSLKLDGAVRSAEGFAQTSWSSRIEGTGLDIARGAQGALVQSEKATQGTLMAPLIARLDENLERVSRSARLTGDLSMRVEGEAFSLVIPEARLRSAQNETILALSRLSLSQPPEAETIRISGNVLTGGSGLPKITGRLEKKDGDLFTARFVMEPYAEGADQIAVPQINLRQDGTGGYRFSGLARLSGAIPGGNVKNAAIPLNGRFSARSGLMVGTRCETMRFDAMTLADVTLERQSVQLCPQDGLAMVSYNQDLAMSAIVSDLSLEAKLADAPARFDATSAVISYPGGVALEDFTLEYGVDESAVRLTGERVSGDFDEALTGSFTGASAQMNAVPLDISALEGDWSYTDGILQIGNANFTLSDRVEGQARFEPLKSEGATLSFDGTDISALALLRHPASGAQVAEVSLSHNLAQSRGLALINVEALTFGPNLSVKDLSRLTFGDIAYTTGTVSGGGRVDWAGDAITSSGVFRTDDLDLAAAFGPVEGLKGEIRFTDLLNITTAPSQTITIGSINPGIEALDGKIVFAITNGANIEIEDARWPFMGGELIMRPTILRFGEGNGQRYTFEIIDLDAAEFVAQMELTNFSATGTFNGAVPIDFDADGNGKIDGGLLISETTGGNVSYIGELTYEDMGTLSNFAFNALRSLDYGQMSVELNGDLAGEIITRFTIDGVSQGESASKNIITRRLAKLPLRFNVNVRAENFYELATMVRSFWDPDALGNPVDQNLIEKDGTRTNPAGEPDPSQTPPNASSPAIRPDEPGVQPADSETLP